MRELDIQSSKHSVLETGLFKHSRHLLSNCQSRSRFNNRLIFKSFSLAIMLIVLVSFIALAIVSGTVTSSQTLHMTGAIYYPTTTPVPTPVPSAIPTPTPNSNNLAPLNIWSYTPYASKYSTVEWQGKTAIKLQDFGPPYTGQNGMADREIDTPIPIPVKPGDVIVLSAWFWTEPSTIGDTSALHGAELELDFLNAITVNNENGIGVPARGLGTTVPWGSNAWVHQTMTFTVPNSWQPTELIVPITIYSSNPGAEGAAVYIYGTELYIN